MQQNFTLLSLGDSYTIGENVALYESFPYQAVQILRQHQVYFSAPEIIARTGFTASELDAALKANTLLNRYDFVTLLVGVNNQYRGLEVPLFKMEFEELLKKSIALANGKPAHVIVISIPDYSVTPFAQKLDPPKIAAELEVFNNVCKALSIQYKTQYVNITAASKKAATNAAGLAPDGLHPSAQVYKDWAQKLAALLLKLVN